MLKLLRSIMERSVAGADAKTVSVAVSPYGVAEGIGGHFHYHIQQSGKAGGLCGARVMRTSVPLDAWGAVTHLNDKWCEDCYNNLKDRTQ
jgi:hypothetical protein